MVALSVYIYEEWYYLGGPLGTEVYVNLVNGNDVPLGKSPVDNPDYIIGYQLYNDLRISVSTLVRGDKLMIDRYVQLVHRTLLPFTLPQAV
jgi:hypothetical protein